MMIPHMPGRDTRTSRQGIYARHAERCALTADPDARCTCTPTYYGAVWDRHAARVCKTRRWRLISEAAAARDQLRDQLRAGPLPVVAGTAGTGGAGGTVRLGEVRDRFIDAARDGVALNKWGRRYRRTAIDDIESALRHIPDDLARRRPDDLGRGDVQRLVDDLTPRLSGSRVRSVVNSLRALWRYAQDRDLARGNPAELVRLPAMDAAPRDRVATPAELGRLLAVLDPADALPYALAAYATARAQEIRTLDWQHVDLTVGAVELAADEEGRKPGGSWRLVPLARPLRTLLRERWLAQGRPDAGRVCPPRRRCRSGMLSLGGVADRAREAWARAKLEPIGLHEARHTAATWLDHAGVSPKVASQLMGHRTPDYQPGAAAITLRRYTHVLPDELERARDQLDRFIAERTKEARSVT